MLYAYVIDNERIVLCSLQIPSAALFLGDFFSGRNSFEQNLMIKMSFLLLLIYRALAKLCNERKDDWDEYLDPTLFSLRKKDKLPPSTPHSSCFTIVRQDSLPR